MKKTNYFWLLAIAAVVGWASLETFRLREATQQAGESQHRHLRTSAKLEAARAKQTQVAHVEVAPPSSTQK